MSDLADIIGRLEKATGPDRELDSLIARSLERFPTERFKGSAPFGRLEGMYWVFGQKDTPNGPIEEKWSKCPPLYTASIDAALTLVPEGFHWRVDVLTGLPRAAVCKPNAFLTASTAPVLWHGKTPAIALCIAALKACASGEKE